MYYLLALSSFSILILIIYFLGYKLLKKYSKKTKIKIRLIILSIILITTNVISYDGGFGNYFFGTLNYCYSDKNYNFQDCELLMKNKKYHNIQKVFEHNKKLKDINSKEVLYRNFKKNYLFFWLWYDYSRHPKWKLKYLAPKL